MFVYNVKQEITLTSIVTCDATCSFYNLKYDGVSLVGYRE